DLAEIHLGIILGEDVVEAALRDTHVKRHLAAFEAVDRDARTAGLALLAAAGGLALARADAASDAHLALTRTFIVAEIVQFHVVHSLSLLSRWKNRKGAISPLPFVCLGLGESLSSALQPYAAPCGSFRGPRGCPRAR